MRGVNDTSSTSVSDSGAWIKGAFLASSHYLLAFWDTIGRAGFVLRTYGCVEVLGAKISHQRPARRSNGVVPLINSCLPGC